MRGLRLGLVVVAAAPFAAALVGPARAADRSDPIPATVGPPGGVGFYANPAAPGLDPARVQEILVRSLVRWGNTYLGPTNSAPGVEDGVSVIGVTALPDGLLGLAQVRTDERTIRTPAHTVCARVPRRTGDTVRRTNRSLRILLRHDVVVDGAVRRRTIPRTLRVPRFKRVRTPVRVRVCTRIAATTSTSVSPEYDVLLKPSPQFGPWSLGPAPAVAPAYDFETNVLHELGHISGLAHQIDGCDPATPMPSGQSQAEYWHAVEEWRRPGCAVQFPPAPAAPAPDGSDSVEPLPGAGRALAGQRILVNPRVPAGYDPTRFVAVAERAIRRAGGTPAGVTTAAPVAGDGKTVLGFAGLRDGVLTSWGTAALHESVPAYTVRSCRSTRVRVLREAVLRRTVRSGSLRLRRDSIRTEGRAVRGYRCKRRRIAARSGEIAPELDVRVSDTAVAWELGPRLPVDGTRWDLESALLRTLASASGAPTGSACDTATPNSSAGLSPGDWWRSSSEVRRTRCLAGTSNRAALGGGTARPRSVPAGDGHELPAAGVPYDRP